MRPSPEEVKAADEVLERIKQGIMKVFPDAETVHFGSRRSGLALKKSDIDLCVMTRGKSLDPFEALTLLSDYFGSRNEEFHKIELVTARIPILKFQDVTTTLKIDIGVNNESSGKGVEFYTKKLEEMPILTPLVLVVKQFLLCRRLNETYTGGVGSFLVFLMVSNFLKVC